MFYRTIKKDEEKMPELSLDDLEGVSGGYNPEWLSLDVIFNGGEMWVDLDDINLTFGKRFNLYKKIEKITGVKIDLGCIISPDSEIKFRMPDGSVVNSDYFLDYVREHYTMDEILTWADMKV